MFKQTVIYLLLSIVVVLFAKFAGLLIVYIDLFYIYLNVKLSLIFSHSELGIMFQKVLTLVLLPICIAAIPALLYRAIKGHHMPYTVELTWILWLVIVLSKVLIH